jgi:hypothetical protein
MKRLSLILLFGAALLAQTGCDDWEDLVFDFGYYADPGYGWYDSGGGCDGVYVEEYWYEETYYESSWYDDWLYW